MKFIFKKIITLIVFYVKKNKVEFMLQLSDKLRIALHFSFIHATIELLFFPVERLMKKRNDQPYILLLLSVLLAAAVLCAVFFGSAKMSLSEFFAALLQKEGFETQSAILFSLRLPRVAAGVLAGMGLSLSGSLLQATTGNSLASPNILGINAGAGFCMILLLSVFPQAAVVSPLFCFVGAFATAVFILALANRLPQPGTGVLLAGIAVTAVFNAGISLVSLLDTDVLAAYRWFSVGGVDSITDFKVLLLPAGMIFVCLALSLLFAKRADVLCLGDTAASALGINTRSLRTLILLLAAASAAAVVSFAGLLGFVGLIVPHLARKLAGTSLQKSLSVSVLLGAVIVTGADLVGRLVIAPSQLPVGIVMALVGAPFYFYLLLRRANHAEI